MRTHHRLCLTLVTTAVLALTTTPAHASTTFHSGTITYTCKFPDGSPQTVYLVDEFTGPDTAAPGRNFLISNVEGSVTLSPDTHAWLTGHGSDGVTGSGRIATFIEAANAPRSSTTAATTKQQTWGTDPVTIDFAGERQGHQAAAAGSITFTAGTLILLLSLHRPDGNPGFMSVVCQPQEGQDTGFTPALPIG